MRICLLLILLLIASLTAPAQAKPHYISDPLDLRPNGWNKVLLMANGNTMLFHFNDNKAVVVKVFDSLHTEIASQKHLCRALDIFTIKSAIFKGLFALGGEAVLFMEQERNSRHTLIRLRFNCQTGQLIEEKIMGQSAGSGKPTHYFVMNNKGEHGYAILFATDVLQFKECDLHVTYYNSSHETVREVPLKVDRKNYDFLKVVGAEAKPNGIMVAVSLSNMMMNKTESDVSPQRDIFSYHMDLYYIPKDSTSALKTVVNLSTSATPYTASYTYNAFAKSLNVLLFSYLPFIYRFGIDVKRGAAAGSLFFKMDEDNSDVKFNWVNGDKVNDYLRSKTDTSRSYTGIPLRMFTNGNGLTTMLSQSYDRYDEPETWQRYNYYSYFGNIGVTQADDDGNELWGTVLPLSQRFKSYRNYYDPQELIQKDQAHHILEDLPEQSYQRQFVSYNAYCHDKNIYVIYNDYNKNFSNSIERPGDTVYNMDKTNACYYKINKNKEVTKSYLFGTPWDNQFQVSFIEGADFDEEKGVYATLLQCWKNDNYTLCMAWRKLD